MRGGIVKLFHLLTKISALLFAGGLISVIPLMATVGIGLALALSQDGHVPANWKDAGWVQLGVAFSLMASASVLFVVQFVFMGVTAGGYREFIRYMKMSSDEYLKVRWGFDVKADSKNRQDGGGKPENL